MWDATTDPSDRSHPGRLVIIQQSPIDAGLLLLGFDSGFLLTWALVTEVYRSHTLLENKFPFIIIIIIIFVFYFICIE